MFYQRSRYHRNMDVFFTNMFYFFIAFLLVAFLFDSLVQMFTSFLIPRRTLLLRDICLGWLALLVNLKILKLLSFTFCNRS